MGLCSEVADGGENLEDHPRPPEQIRLPQGPVSACKIRKFVSGGVEPFSLRPDKILPGTLHHSGIRPAPPSDHTPLARRSAFQPGQSGPPGRNSNARAGLERLDSVDERAPTDVLIEVRAGYSRPSPRLRRRPAGARSRLTWLHFVVALVATRNFKH